MSPVEDESGNEKTGDFDHNDALEKGFFDIELGPENESETEHESESELTAEEKWFRELEKEMGPALCEFFRKVQNGEDAELPFDPDDFDEPEDYFGEYGCENYECEECDPFFDGEDTGDDDD